MEKAVNIREVAKAAGVSTASVSRALQRTPSPFLSEAQRNHILAVCEQLHYQPNVHARRLFAKQANTMAICFSPIEPRIAQMPYPTMDEPFGSCLLGLNAVLVKAGVQLLLTELSENFLSKKRHLAMCRNRMVDGIFLWGALHRDTYVNELLREKIPLLMLQTDWPETPCPSVVADDYAGSCSVTAQLVAAGHRRIAVLRPWLDGSAGAARYHGILDTLAQHRLQPVYETVHCGYDYDFGRQAAAEILERAPGVTAIAASNDSAAWGCIDGLRARNLTVPADLSIGGGDGIRNYNAIQVCSFTSPSYLIGQTGATLMLEHLAGRTVTGRHCLPVTPIAGNTIAPPRTTTLPESSTP